jgi:hypothetical protein
MFSEVPGVKHALGSTTTTRATRGAIIGLGTITTGVESLWVVHDRVLQSPAVDHLAEPGRLAAPGDGCTPWPLCSFRVRLTTTGPTRDHYFKTHPC